MSSRSHAPDPLGKAMTGRFVVERCLGEGSMGAVYLAEDEKLGRRVALKVLPLGVRALSGQASLRLRREVEAIARLDHPGARCRRGIGDAVTVERLRAFAAECRRQIEQIAAQQRLAA